MFKKKLFFLYLKLKKKNLPRLKKKKKIKYLKTKKSFLNEI